MDTYAKPVHLVLKSLQLTSPPCCHLASLEHLLTDNMQKRSPEIVEYENRMGGGRW